MYSLLQGQRLISGFPKHFLMNDSHMLLRKWSNVYLNFLSIERKKAE
ncbi:hypothetical protein HMPREF0201_02428 [Cedecea davisae DSM 4568]|uniref:Uncharacterized protein n=1 Tax=Cedecea davisae DSM 4568 TaxID=566551 RepID=S3J999_9ENTR|nr:hypothetical protein HMPREF0201_02428 [Cedecea davisae DSM 4568]